jgi:hypothetical protein
MRHERAVLFAEAATSSLRGLRSSPKQTNLKHSACWWIASRRQAGACNDEESP